MPLITAEVEALICCLNNAQNGEAFEQEKFGIDELIKYAYKMRSR